MLLPQVLGEQCGIRLFGSGFKQVRAVWDAKTQRPVLGKGFKVVAMRLCHTSWLASLELAQE